MQSKIEAKQENLTSILKQYDRLLIAFSGGVDSTYLLAVAHAQLQSKVLAVTDRSPLHSQRETQFAVKFAQQFHIPHLLIDIPILEINAFQSNPVDRCYWCKQTLIKKLIEIADKQKIHHIAHGANMDDLDDFRPGLRAAQESGIVAPLIAAELTKAEIRKASKAMQLETWNKPSMACLASRVPYGTPITQKLLEQIEQAETVLMHHGFIACRVRHHGEIARIELDPKDVGKILEPRVRTSIVHQLRKLGFSHIAVDLEGYSQGRLNRSHLEAHYRRISVSSPK
jgi:uncharacterized protein